MTVKLRGRMKHGTQDGWTADIRVRLPSGVMYRERVKAPGDTKSLALRWAKDREAEIIRHGPPNARKEELLQKVVPTLKDFEERFLGHADTNNKPSTAYAKRKMLKKQLRPFFGTMRLDAVTVAEVERYKAAKLAEKLSRKSVNNHLTILRKLLNLAAEWGEIPAPPKIKPLALELPPFEFLEFDEADRLLAAASDEWRSMMTVAVKTGLRPGELRALRWADVDLVAGRIIVRHTLWRDKEGTPKGGKPREVPLCASALAARKAQKAVSRLKSAYVFCNAEAGPLVEHAIEGVVAATCRRAGLSKVLSWHGLRHTFASHLVMRGVPLKAVQELMGHTTIEMTMRYAHLSPDVRKDAVRVLDAPAPVASIVARPEAE